MNGHTNKCWFLLLWGKSVVSDLSGLFHYVYRSSGSNLTGLPVVHNSPFHQNIQSRTRKKSHKGKFLDELITMNLGHKYSLTLTETVEDLNLSQSFHGPVTLLLGCCSFLVLHFRWSMAVSEMSPPCVPPCLGTAKVLSSKPNISWVALLLCNW